jgi:hypothetical protein
LNRQRLLMPLAALTLVVAACGGASPTQAPGGATANPGGGGAATDAAPATNGPAATQSGAGGGGSKPAGWDQYGKVHIEISGPVSHAGDYGFLPAGSIFGGAQGSSLNFTIEGSNEIVSILVGPDGAVVVSYGSEAMSAPAAQCTTSNWNLGATSGSGSFDCTAALIILSSGATVTGGQIKGSFEARAS